MPHCALLWAAVIWAGMGVWGMGRECVCVGGVLLSVVPHSHIATVPPISHFVCVLIVVVVWCQ